jgi:hypothetical protein
MLLIQTHQPLYYIVYVGSPVTTTVSLRVTVTIILSPILSVLVLPVPVAFVSSVNTITVDAKASNAVDSDPAALSQEVQRGFVINGEAAPVAFVARIATLLTLVCMITSFVIMIY